MTRTRAFVTALVFFLLSVSSGLLATEWHVAPWPRGNNSNPGTEELPFATIQHGIDASSDGDTVIVAKGTYYENIHFNGKNIVLTSTDPLNPTVVARTVIDGDKARSVVTFSGTETEACVLSGLTIRNGKILGGGGGICGGTDPHYTHATIQSNTITGNSALSGGGLCGCDGTIRNNTIIGNSAQYNGGGLCGCNGTIQNNTITGNSADWGGGLYHCDGIIQNNTMTSNSAGQNCGGLAFCDGAIQNNTITSNSAQGDGGGLYWCHARIQNNMIVGNSAQGDGGGLWQCDVTVQNNTITGNSAGGNGGGLCNCAWAIRNCIIWGNTSPSGPQLYGWNIPTYSCIQDWAEGGEGNIASNPRFVDRDGPDNDPQTFADNDYRLSASSPCIDAGMNEDWMWTATDLDGNPRVFYGGLSLTVDMGAYEYGSFPFRIVAVEKTAFGEPRLAWTSRPGDEYVVWSCADLTSGDWTEEQAVVSAGDSTSWTDPSPGGSRKFYRVEQL